MSLFKNSLSWKNYLGHNYLPFAIYISIILVGSYSLDHLKTFDLNEKNDVLNNSLPLFSLLITAFSIFTFAVLVPKFFSYLNIKYFADLKQNEKLIVTIQLTSFLILSLIGLMVSLRWGDPHVVLMFVTASLVGIIFDVDRMDAAISETKNTSEANSNGNRRTSWLEKSARIGSLLIFFFQLFVVRLYINAVEARVPNHHETFFYRMISPLKGNENSLIVLSFLIGSYFSTRNKYKPLLLCGMIIVVLLIALEMGLLPWLTKK